LAGIVARRRAPYDAQHVASRQWVRPARSSIRSAESNQSSAFAATEDSTVNELESDINHYIKPRNENSVPFA
jgi:hypothetical protein